MSLRENEHTRSKHVTRMDLDKAEHSGACRQQAAETISGGNIMESTSDSCSEQAVVAGDLESWFESAWLSFTGGGGVEQSYEKALDYWQRVINIRSKLDDDDEGANSILKTISTYMVGLCRYLGVGTERDLVTGWMLINQSKSLNHEFVLAGQWAFDWDWGEPIDKIQSSTTVSKVFFENVSLGPDHSNNSLLRHLEGVCYFYGFGTSKDQTKAVQIFETLANSGFAASQVFLGACYHSGCVVEKNPKTAVEWFKKSTGQGYAWGQSALSYCYFRGSGVYHDNAEALEWLKKAANQGHAGSEGVLGYCYEKGLGVPQDHAEAVEWYQRAADQGSATSQYSLGIHYGSGIGVTQDYAQAVEWYRKAAQRGHAEAQDGLANSYKNGHGVTQDYAKAAEWYRMASNQGVADAKTSLENISRRRQFWSQKCTYTRVNPPSAKSYVNPRMDERSKAYCLIPVSTNKFLHPTRELMMLGMPQSVEEMYDLFQSKENKPVVIWMGVKDCFVHDWKTDRPESYSVEFKWYVFNSGRSVPPFYICSTRLHGGITCLGSLFELSMDSFDSSILALPETFDTVDDSAREPKLCPFPCEILEKYILQNKVEKCCFWSMTFTPLQCKTLATSGEKTHLFFRNCRFLDKGSAFVEAYLSKENQELGPSRLDFNTSIPFDDMYLVACVHKLQELTLNYITNLSLNLGRALVSAQLNYLQLGRWLKLKDDASTMLINNIRQGRGPKGISIHPSVFGSRAKFVEFCDALSFETGQTHLEALELAAIGYHSEEPDPQAESSLLAAWRGNLGLTSFGLTSSCITEGFWNSLLNQVSLQPSIRKLDFSALSFENNTATGKERTEQLSNLILANEHIEQVGFCEKVFDWEAWNTCVIPALQMATVTKAGDLHMRKGILAKALKKVNIWPSLLYALLHQNLDAITDTVAGERNESK